MPATPEQILDTLMRNRRMRAGMAAHSPAEYLHEKVVGKRTAKGTKCLKRLRPVHRTILGMHLSGLSAADIGFATGYSQSEIYTILEDPLCQAYIELHLSRGVDAEIEALLPMAVDAIRAGLETDDLKLRLLAADKTLKATGKIGGDRQQKSETAEDVVARLLSVMKDQSETVREMVRNDPAARFLPDVVQERVLEEDEPRQLTVVEQKD